MTEQERDADHPAKRLGRKLREARIAAGYRSQESFGTVINLHRTAVTKIELGNRHISAELLRKWCDLCHVDFDLYEAGARLAWVAEASQVPEWFENFFRAQILAHTIRCWCPIILPGLLQIPDYARALYELTGTDDALIAEWTDTRIDLQQNTLERKPPVKLVAVLHESVLYSQVGTREVMHKQLEHLAEMAQRKNVAIQVVPTSRGANAGHAGAFTIASLDDGDVLLMEGLEDSTTDKRATIRGAFEIFDRVRWVALSGPESLELIMKAAETCRP